LIETDQTTIVLDVSPDIKDQLHTTDTSSVNAFFVTHHHFDHVGGLHELAHAAMGFEAHVGIESGHLPQETFSADEKPVDPTFTVYLSETAESHVEGSNPHLAETLDLRRLEHGVPVEVSGLQVVPFPVEHARSAFDTLGFAVYHGDSKVVYAPDMWEFMDDSEYVNPDLLFVEGAALFRAFGHGKEDDLRSALAATDANRTVLINLSEHLQRMTTDELQETASEDGYELGRDFAEYQP